MAISPVASTSSVLSSIQVNSAQVDTNWRNLSTGRSVNSVTDNAQSFVLAQGLLDRASSLAGVGSEIGQGIGALQTANDGLSAIGSVVNQLKAVTQQAQSTSDPTQLSTLQSQYNTLRGQIDSLAADSSYGGVNLISANPGAVNISSAGSGAGTTVSGAASDSASLGISAAGNWGAAGSTLQSDAANLDAATQTLRSQAADLGSNITLLQTQASFVQGQGAIASQGASQLTGTDPYAAAANVVAADTYRQLGYAALRNSAQTQEAVLGLFTHR